MKFKQLLHKAYFNSSILNRRDYERGRKLFIFEGSTGMGVFFLTTGAFLSGLANYMGASDEFNGIIGAIPVFAGVAQMFSSLVFEKLHRRKFLISLLCLIFRLLLGIMFFIPLFTSNTALRLALLAVIYGLAYSLSAFITPALSNWLIDLTPVNIRGNYLARKDAFSLAFITVITFVLGKMLDIFKQNNNEISGFVILGLIIIFLGVSNFGFLTYIKEPVIEKINNDIKLKHIFIKPVKDKKFRLIIILFITWNIALQIAGPFFSVYMVTRLNLSYMYIMVMGVISSLVRMFIVPIWGRIADNKSWVTCTKYSIGLLAVCHFLWLFVNNITVIFLVPLLHVIGGMAWAGINIALFNIQFLFSPKEGRTMYLGLNAAVGGLLGFLSTIVGSRILTLLGDNGVTFFNFNFSNMQILFSISGILLTICTLYINLFIKENN
ncbi:MFS transporter [Clostridium sp. SYSU_GA19001]|uniref:MFS transporter n=1 Tax=Clostridium caldaquaticum TaxID=2940653 RepID=UPI00207775AE|nr:MFS transporter [Clostridium caldaquaticum]MCM8711479.1 MFS transporter [Clostridium caldaquaticum]